MAKTSHLSNERFEETLKRFVAKVENEGIVDERLKYKILNASPCWNKEELIGDMIKKIEVFKDYDEKEVEFPYKPYLEKLLEK